jgi:NAD(P)-dependent dehydrogenase (short-subunit alcohol dehydrogenase family)
LRLQGKRALVTGASRGIGKSVALKLAEEGAEVVVNYLSQETAAHQVVEQIRSMGSRSLAVQGATHIPSNVETIVQTSLDFLGEIDILVNNAGVLTRTPFLEIPEAEWTAIMETNLKGYFLMGQAVASKMVDNAVQGSIVNISSVLQSVTAPNLTHYSVSKAGVGMLTKQMALELAPNKIRVNAVAPGLISTDMNSKDLEKPEFENSILSDIPLKIIGEPDDIAGSIIFLCSDQESRLITGTTIFIDGGRSLK